MSLFPMTGAFWTDGSNGSKKTFDQLAELAGGRLQEGQL
jgi:hypothetical protein